MRSKVDFDMRWIYVTIIVILVILATALLFKQKLPASMVVLRWDYDKIVMWLEDNKTFLGPRNDGTTFLHDMARYRIYFSEKDTDYEKLQRLVAYYADHEGNFYSKNQDGLTAYDLALKYDTRIADMIKQAEKKRENETGSGTDMRPKD